MVFGFRVLSNVGVGLRRILFRAPVLIKPLYERGQLLERSLKTRDLAQKSQPRPRNLETPYTTHLTLNPKP